MDNSNNISQKIGPVLLVALSQGYGGADVRVFDLAKAFHGRISYAVATLHNSPLQQKLDAAGLQTRPLPYARSDPRLLWKIRHLIKEEGFQIVDAHNPQSQFWGLLAAKLTATPMCVSTVHHAYGDVDHIRLRDKLYEKVLLANIRWRCQFITVSQSIYTYLQQVGVKQENLALIHNAIDLPAIAAQIGDNSWRETLDWGEGTVVIIIVGRLEPVKGHTYLLQALQTAVQTHPQLRCLIVGDGRLREEIETEIITRNLSAYVYLAGFRDDVTTLLSGSDIFCMASLSEGLPYALLEASAFKLPFVVTNVDGIAELFTDKKNALLLPVADVQALSDALCQLADNPQERSTLGQSAYDFVQSRLQPERMLADTFAIYQKR